MKATTLLQQQHRNLQQLCEVVERGSASIRRSLLPQLAGDLAAYLAVEEQVFYPAASAALHEPSWVDAEKSWHLRALRSLQCALDASVESEEFEAAIAELRAAVALHVVEDEQLLFPRLERALDAGAMRQLGQSMMALYEAELEAGYHPATRSA